MIAIVRGVPDSFERAVARVPRRIDVRRARQQHARYVDALRGLVDEIVVLEGDEAHPDCPFVEDQAVVVGRAALMTRCGHPSRRGESPAVRRALADAGLEVVDQERGTLDGGDVMRVGDVLYAGRSERTDAEGLSALAALGLPVVPLPVHDLHLKSVCSAVSDRLVLLAPDTLDPASFHCEVLVVPAAEAHAANAVAVGRKVLLAAGCPLTRGELVDRGFDVVEVGTGEFRKADGALTCLSILV